MKNKKAYKVLIAATGVNFLSGILYIWSVISKALIEDLNWTSKQASLPYTALTIFFVIAMVIFGKVQDEKGPRYPGIFGCILMGSGLILAGIFTNPIAMILSMGIITGTGIGMINASTAPPVVKWFPKEKKGLVTGIVVGGVGLSSVLYSPLANYLIPSVGVSKTLIYIGIGALVLSTLLARFLENPPEDFNTESKTLNKIKSGKDYTVKEMLKTLNFYKLWIMLAFSSTAGLMVIGHLSTIAKVQIGWEAGFVLVILIAIFNTLGRILGGSISDKIGRINLMKIIFIIQAINMFFFPYYLNVGLLSLGVILAGLCYGASFSVFPAATTDFYGIKNFGANYGIIFTGWGLGGVIGPMTAAIIFDARGSYNSAYILAGILLVISTLIAFTFKEEKV